METFYREAEAFISKQKEEQPFFLYLALTAPHTPISPSKKFKGKSELGVYGDFVMEVDHGVERVMKALKNHGFHENTLVLFSSDHGAASYAGNILQATANQILLLRMLGHYAGGPYRGFKFSIYGGGLRVPLIAHWPGVVPRGTQCDELVGLNDLMATFADITGKKMGRRKGPDSISFAKLLRNPKAKGKRQNLILQSTGPFAIRDGKWKLCLCPGSGSDGRFATKPKSVDAWRDALKQFGKAPKRTDLTKAPFVQLFDVTKDVHEDHNLAAKYPQRVTKMVELLQRQIDDGRSTPGPKLANGRKNINVIQRLPDFVGNQLK
ncbi:MAG: sulfatase-like hydrolase/transferase [Gemmataceae bacterium]